MPFSNVPVRNPGRYFEQFVKVVQPRSMGGAGMSQPVNPGISFSGFQSGNEANKRTVGWNPDQNQAVQNQQRQAQN